MGVEYDIVCRTCDDKHADFGDGRSKNLEAFREALKMRTTLERWADEDIDISLNIGHGQTITPSFFVKHKGHELAVMGDNGTDYSRPWPEAGGAS